MHADDVFRRPYDELAVGARFATPARTIRELDVAAFAELTGDRHPAHTDDRWAAAGPFGERIAHGLLVLSCLLPLLPVDEELVARVDLTHAVFKAPVAIGARVRLVGRVRAVGPLSGGLALVRLSARVVDGEGRTRTRAGLDAHWHGRVQRRASIAPTPARSVVAGRQPSSRSARPMS